LSNAPYSTENDTPHSIGATAEIHAPHSNGTLMTQLPVWKASAPHSSDVPHSIRQGTSAPNSMGSAEAHVQAVVHARGNWIGAWQVHESCVAACVAVCVAVCCCAGCSVVG